MSPGGYIHLYDYIVDLMISTFMSCSSIEKPRPVPSSLYQI